MLSLTYHRSELRGTPLLRNIRRLDVQIETIFAARAIRQALWAIPSGVQMGASNVVQGSVNPALRVLAILDAEETPCLLVAVTCIPIPGNLDSNFTVRNCRGFGRLAVLNRLRA